MIPIGDGNCLSSSLHIREVIETDMIPIGDGNNNPSVIVNLGSN